MEEEKEETGAKKSIRMAINGFGRIGRQTARALFDKYRLGEIKRDDLELVAVNDLTDPKSLAHLLKYDSVYGILENKVGWSDKTHEKAFKGEIDVDGVPIGTLSEPEPAKLPWRELDIDVVIESTGRFTNKEDASAHLKAGAKKVIISAPAKEGEVGTYIMGVNMDKLTKSEDVISNASCTTNCIAPIMAIMQKKFGIEKSLMTTVHAFTADQMLVDGPHRDLRRARSASINIVPTTTGAAIAAALTVPEIKDKFDGLSIRVPVPVGSISDVTMLLARSTTVEEINRTIMDECEDPRWRGIVTYTSDPIVSSDIIGNPHSSIVDLSLTQVVDNTLAKVVAWYDNEWAYSCRLVEQVIYFGAMIEK
ncbi:MAG: type I glyceraldehyde-3-phosphate dehydrogenase [Candidatus Berkelbacteria bacterium]|nr:type I glyceraldehyde-3-phosphate dehydrogenase [Candidatus Berkelbacteria bacterium]